VTGDTFLAVMENTALCHVPVKTVCQLNGVSANFSCCVCAFLDGEFPDSWIGTGGPIPWHPGSPDLNSLDFFI